MIAQKTVPSTLYLAIKKNLTLAEVPAYADIIIPQLIQACEQLGLAIAGPLAFLYDGSDGAPDTLFGLTIAMPIDAMKANSSQFDYLTTSSFQCVYVEYKGNIYGIGGAWHEFFASVLKADLILTGQCREVYQNWVDHGSADNITELQIGIADSV